MSKKISLVMLVVLLASLVVTPAGASNPPEPLVPKAPLSWPGVPTRGPLTPEQIKKLPPPPEDTSALDEQFKAGLAKIEAEAAAKGLKVRAVPTEKLEAGKALGESLTEEQRQAIGEAFSRREKALKRLMAPVEAAFKARGKLDAARSLEAEEKPEVASLEVARRLEGRLRAWQAALDSDIEKVLTEKQLVQYRASRPTVPKPDVTMADLAALGLEVPKGEGASLKGSCTDCYYSYIYGYYAYVYQWYAYVYAYYGWYYSGCSWAYYAYIYHYYAVYYAYYAYIYQYYAYVYCYDATYAYYAYLYHSYAYYYAYYAYIYQSYALYYCNDAYGYLDASYYYGYYAYVYSYYSYVYSYYCYYSSLGLLGVPNYQQEQTRRGGLTVSH